MLHVSVVTPPHSQAVANHSQSFQHALDSFSSVLHLASSVHTWASERGGMGAFTTPGFWILTSSYAIFNKKRLFFVWSGQIEISPFCPTLEKSLSGKNPSDAHECIYNFPALYSLQKLLANTRRQTAQSTYCQNQTNFM